MAANEMQLNEMIELARLPDNEEIVMQMLDIIGNKDPEELRKLAPAFETLLESWSEDITKNVGKAELCVKLADKGVLDSENFRVAMNFAVRKLLPPYLAGGSVVKAIGARDPSVPIATVAMRLHKLQNLRTTALVYQQETHQWGKITGIDRVTGTIGVSGISSTNVVSSVPIATAVITSHFFNLTPEFLTLLDFPDKANRIGAEETRRIFKQNALVEIPEAKMREILFFLLVPETLDQAGFDKWWVAKVIPAAETVGKRSFADARSILELYTILPSTKSNSEETTFAVSEEAAAKLRSLFERQHFAFSAKDIAMLIDCVAILSKNCPDDNLRKRMFEPLRGKVSFWPAVVDEHLTIAGLEPWGHISVKLLDSLVAATNTLYTEQESALIGTRLPLRCIPFVMDSLPSDVVFETVRKIPHLSPDLILWIFKNSTKMNPRLLESIDMGCVVDALCLEALPKEWTSAQRELKKNLFEKKAFQKFVIDNAQEDIPSVIAAIQRCRAFQGGERQSIMVKLAAVSPELKTRLESGEGRKMMKNAAAAPAGVQVLITSIVSHKKRAAELEDLINVQIPENAAAVALARSYGDLRENAEYDAAKEKRRFLQKRRSEMEKELANIQSTDFSDVKLDGHAVLGSVVRLASASGELKDYYLVGAWDGDPEKNRISYITKLGKELLDKKVGDSVTIAESGKFTVKEILPLPGDLRKELAAEA